MTKHKEARKREIGNSLHNILEHTALEKITIDQICQEAQIHRSTFYRYFKDKYDLLEFVFNEMFIARIDYDNVVESIIRLISSEKEIFRNVFNNNSNGDYYLFGVILKIVSEGIYQAAEDGKLHDVDWLQKRVLQSDHPRLAAEIIAGGLLTGLIHWISTNYEMSEEELANFVVELTRIN